MPANKRYAIAGFDKELWAQIRIAAILRGIDPSEMVRNIIQDQLLRKQGTT